MIRSWGAGNTLLNEELPPLPARFRGQARCSISQPFRASRRRTRRIPDAPRGEATGRARPPNYRAAPPKLGWNVPALVSPAAAGVVSSRPLGPAASEGAGWVRKCGD